MFKNYIGVDYSGAETSNSRLSALRVYATDKRSVPTEIRTPSAPAGAHWNWSRVEVANWLVERVRTGEPCIVGIDHSFSFPRSYFNRYSLNSWQDFVEDFVQHWPTHRPNTYVDDIRENAPKRVGFPNEIRLTEQWTSSTKSVFRFDVQGQVAKSTHAGIPWLHHIRTQCPGMVHFWPFDGWKPPGDKSVIVEVYPSIFRRRYASEKRTADQHDAYSVARWLYESDRLARLSHYLAPPLTEDEERCAVLEGWILGIT